MKRLAESEIDLSNRLYALARQDSTIGFEASNHYYYRPLDLAEKILNVTTSFAVLSEGKPAS